jgi:hypothetical protein
LPCNLSVFSWLLAAECERVPISKLRRMDDMWTRNNFFIVLFFLIIHTMDSYVVTIHMHLTYLVSTKSCLSYIGTNHTHPLELLISYNTYPFMLCSHMEIVVPMVMFITMFVHT